MKTIDDVARLMNCTRPEAYGLVHFMEKLGVVKPAGKKKDGSKGKPATLYDFSEDDVINLVGILEPIFANDAPATTPAVEAVATPTVDDAPAVQAPVTLDSQFAEAAQTF